MEKSFSDLGVEYSFYVKNYLVEKNIIKSFEYSIIMNYEDMSPGTCSLNSTYTFKKEFVYSDDLNFSNLIDLILEEEGCSNIESSSVFTNAYAELLRSKERKIVNCMNLNWSLLSTL